MLRASVGKLPFETPFYALIQRFCQQLTNPYP